MTISVLARRWCGAGQHGRVMGGDGAVTTPKLVELAKAARK
jgi:hypothetical protein